MYRILYISPSPVPPDKNPQKNKFYHLSRYLSGDVLAPIWGVKDSNSARKLKEVNSAMGNFHYYVTFSSKLSKPIKFIWDIFFYLYKGYYLHLFKKKYDIIVAYGPFKTALAAYLLKKLTGLKLIVEIPGNPKKTFTFEKTSPHIKEKFKNKLGDLLVTFIVNRSDTIKLMYPTQLDDYKKVRKDHLVNYHDFVPISILEPNPISKKYILFLGYPWFLKGVDILIKAFEMISAEFPEYRLKIVGFCPDKRYFQELSGGNDKIELLDAVNHDEAMKLMSECSLFVLPSRTEGIARVLLEAMAFRKPIIASRVDGTPYCIRDGFNGLLFESENTEDLAAKMRIMLSDFKYASGLAENGHTYVRENLSEVCYVELFKNMISKTASTKS